MTNCVISLHESPSRKYLRAFMKYEHDRAAYAPRAVRNLKSIESFRYPKIIDIFRQIKISNIMIYRFIEKN